MVFAITSLFAVAQTNSYTDVLVVSIDGSVVDTQTSTIQVIATANGTYELSLRNFILKNPTDPTPVGNISLSNITVTEQDGIKNFTTDQYITITDGDEDMEWRGPDYGEIHVRLTGKMTLHKLYCTIDMILNKQSVNIVFGKKNLTGIEDMTDESEELKVIYDLTGRRIDTITSAGIYIVNGKKVVFM